LFSQRTGGSRREITAYAKDSFFVKGSPDRITFPRSESGSIAALEYLPRLGPSELALRTDEPLPTAPDAISLDPSTLDRYTGTYEIAPGLNLFISEAGGKLLIQLPGEEQPFELLAETPSQMYLREIDITCDVEFGEDDRVLCLIATRAGMTYRCPRLNEA
jgi:hypothetical protein